MKKKREKREKRNIMGKIKRERNYILAARFCEIEKRLEKVRSVSVRYSPRSHVLS